MKKLFMMVAALVLCFGLAGCGGSGSGDGDKAKDDGIDPNATVTLEQYQKLCDEEWNKMTPEDMEKYLGVKYVEDEDSTKDWGEDYLVVDFPGPDDDSYLHVLFKDKDGDGNKTATSLSTTGQLMEQ